MTIVRPASGVVLHPKTTWAPKSLPLQTPSSSAPLATTTPVSVAKIGGIDAPQVLSVIASAFIANRSDESASDSDDETSFMLSIESASNDVASSAVAMSSVVRLSDSTSAAEVAGAQIRTCNPGAFVCEAHGRHPMYFACDAVGMALPATCAANEVCYQYGQSILCDAPGSSLVGQHRRLAMS
ncbi:hypothetical protein IWW47_000092 [Coemansia sp. RSA 2052]|nr:hypothetical protein IWW47_000092 [Coemansia sp. RSA 2052]